MDDNWFLLILIFGLLFGVFIVVASIIISDEMLTSHYDKCIEACDNNLNGVREIQAKCFNDCYKVLECDGGEE